MVDHIPEKDFIRIHHSFIANLEKITIIERNRIILDDSIYIPVSEQSKIRFPAILG